MTVTFKKLDVAEMIGAIRVFVDANHSDSAQKYLVQKEKLKLTHVVVGCSDSRSVSHHHVTDAMHAAFYNTAGQTMDAETITRLKKEYNGRIIIAHKKCGACHAAHEYHQTHSIPSLQLKAVVEAADPDELRNGELRRASLESTYALVYVDVDTLGAVERSGQILPLSGGQYPLAIVWRIGLRYSAAELVHGSALEQPSHLFDVSSLELGHEAVPITSIEHGSLQYAMAHALHGTGSFAHANTFIVVASKEHEVQARRTFEDVLAYDKIVQDYMSRGAKAYLCVREHGTIKEVYQVNF